jgi:HK97 family phage major capsid protein/HK97 family phage prohead protease
METQTQDKAARLALMLKQMQGITLYREAEIRTAKAADGRIRSLTFSSEEPYGRWFGMEILGHGEGEVDLSRLNNKGQALFNHKMDDYIGVVEKAWLSDKKGHAEIRFSERPRAEEMMKDVDNGIITKVSVGYVVTGMRFEKEENGVDYYRVTAWQPLEISLVTIPADDTVGVGRTFEGKALNSSDMIKQLEEWLLSLKGEITNNESITNNQGVKTMGTETTNAAEKLTGEQIKAAANDNAASIMRYGKNHNCIDEALEAVSKQKSFAQFVNEREASAPAPQPFPNKPETKIGLTEKEIKNFSICNAIMAVINPKAYGKAAGLELEASEYLYTKYQKKDHRGLMIPYDILEFKNSEGKDAKVSHFYGHRTMTAGTATAGKELVGTEHFGSSWIDFLMNKMLTVRLGAQYMPGMVGNFSIPKQTGMGNAVWRATETESSNPSDFATASILSTPKTLMSGVDLSIQLLAQSNPYVETLARNELQNRIALAIDKAVLLGSGENGEPHGIIGSDGVGTIDMASMNWEKALEFEGTVDNNNAMDNSNFNFIMKPLVRSQLKARPQSATAPLGYIITADNKMAGHNVETSNQLGTGTTLFGDYSEVIIPEWGVLELIIDALTGARSAVVKLTTVQMLDVIIRYTQKFVYGYNFS